MADRVAQYKERVEKAASIMLTPYINYIQEQKTIRRASKEINDPIWKTIVLYPFEIVILDSPLLQRLRQIKQLGVVHWIYPSAVHTRLEHSIGALSRIQCLLDSINRTTERLDDGEDTRQGIKKRMANLLRLVALCHDVGHGFMSHVVENALDSLGVVTDLKFDLAEYFDKEKCPLSEAAAYFLLGSPAFGKLLDIAQIRYPEHQFPSNYKAMLQNAVIGKTIDERYPLLHEFISGPFDADKLDYMSRDAYMVGVPAVTDVARLVQKIREVEVRTEDLPPDIASRVKSGHPSYFLYAIALSGGRTLDELMLGRTLLFDKVYRHQKVRAAEAMVANMISSLVQLYANEDDVAILPLALNDNDILNLERSALSEKLSTEISDPQWTSVSMQCARDLARRLLDRKIFTRAYCFSHNMSQDPFRGDAQQRTGLENLIRDVKKPEKRISILKRIVQELRLMKHTLPGESWGPEDEHELPYYVALDPPSSHSLTGEIARAYLVTGENKLIRFREDSAESSAWCNAYIMTRDMGYIFTIEELAPMMYLACEKFFREEYRIRTPSTALYYAKADTARIQSLRKQLTAAGFYTKAPIDIRAEADRLGKADIPTRTENIAKKLSLYDGLAFVDGKASKSVRIDSARVLAWLKQFETDDEIEACISALEAIRLIGRSDIHKAIRSFMEKNPEFQGSFVCPFGAPKDSSSIVTYYVQDLAQEYNFHVSTLQDALSSNSSKPILFIDDFISSGQQSTTILKRWMGDSTSGLDEHHGEPLAPPLQDILKSRKVGFIFVCGDPLGKSELELSATTLGISSVIVDIHMPDEALPKAFEGGAVIYKNETQKELFRRRCEEIGTQLLRNYGGKARSSEWIEKRILGYGNKGYLLIFPYNTPTQTLTLLWSDGKRNDWDWLPLVPRRPKT